MLDLYMGNFITIVTTMLIAGIFTFILITLIHHKQINHWGRRVALIAVWGLLLCIFAASRDNYHMSVMALTDSEVTPGLFAADGIQSTINCIAGAVIAFSSLSVIFIRNMKYRRIIFCILSAIILFKVLVIEICRLIIYFV